MKDSTILTGIDVGTTKVCTVVAKKLATGGFDVLAYSVVPSVGLQKGNVADISATEGAVRQSIEEVGEKLGTKVRSAYIGVTGAHVSFENRLDALSPINGDGVVTARQLAQNPERVSASDAGRRLIHAIPMTYSVDGQPGIRDPLGMHARSLEVETHVVTGASTFMDRLVEAVRGAGVTVDALVLEPLASGQAVLTPREREEGVVLVDIGGGTTDLAAFRRGGICYTSVIAIGGYQFTNDICHVYNTTYSAAEPVKIKHASAEAQAIYSREDVSLPVLGGTTSVQVPVRDICQLTRERALDLIRLIKLKVQEANIGEVSMVPVVVTGGTSRLPGLQTLMQQNVTNHVRMGAPNGRQRLPDALKAPAYATGVGIVMLAADNNGAGLGHATKGAATYAYSRDSGLVSRFLKQVRRLMTVERFSAKGGRA